MILEQVPSSEDFLDILIQWLRILRSYLSRSSVSVAFEQIPMETDMP